MPKLFQSTYFNYSYNIWRFTFIINFLIILQETFPHGSPYTFLEIFPFPSALIISCNSTIHGVTSTREQKKFVTSTSCKCLSLLYPHLPHDSDWQTLTKRSILILITTYYLCAISSSILDFATFTVLRTHLWCYGFLISERCIHN